MILRHFDVKNIGDNMKKPVFSVFIDLKRLIDVGGVMKMSEWVGKYRQSKVNNSRTIPESCLLVKRHENYFDFPLTNIIPVGVIDEFFFENNRLKKCVYFNGSQSDLDDLNSFKYLFNDSNIARHFEYLWYYKSPLKAIAFAKLNDDSLRAIGRKKKEFVSILYTISKRNYNPFEDGESALRNIVSFFDTTNISNEDIELHIFNFLPF
jgi:hypothetical protein